MICHVSLPLDDPERAAPILAELTDGTPVRAPSPPFPHGSWFVCSGDTGGSLLELLPSRFVFDPDAPLSLARRDGSPGRSGAHVLLRTPHSDETVRAIAGRAGWRVQHVETGLFEILKVWIDDAVLVESLPAGTAHRYAEAFGTDGLRALDARLRALEAEMATVLSAEMPPGALAAVLGQPPA